MRTVCSLSISLPLRWSEVVRSPTGVGGLSVSKFIVKSIVDMINVDLSFRREYRDEMRTASVHGKLSIVMCLRSPFFHPFVEDPYAFMSDTSVQYA